MTDSYLTTEKSLSRAREGREHSCVGAELSAAGGQLRHRQEVAATAATAQQQQQQ
jgi:hypothetical protein